MQKADNINIRQKYLKSIKGNIDRNMKKVDKRNMIKEICKKRVKKYNYEIQVN